MHSSSRLPLLVAIVGPTASGKTDCGIRLAEQFNSEILSCDSRQVYRELKIGAASPSDEQLARVSHHMVGCCSVADYFNASMYEGAAISLLQAKFEGKGIMFLVGGSGLYVDAVLNGIDDLPSVPAEIRSYFLSVFESEGLSGLQNRLLQADSEYYSQVDLNNPKRLLKALEVTTITGKPYSSYLKGKPKSRPFRTLLVGLDPGRSELYQSINQRALAMMDAGLVDEVSSLLKYRQLNALNTVGYKEIFDFLDGKTNLQEAVVLIQNSTRRYARKQMTWFRRYPDIRWFHPSEIDQIAQWINQNR